MKNIKFILVVAALLLGLVLRLDNYSIYPQRGATSDEYFYAFLGWTMLFGQTDFTQIKLSTIRLVPIFLSTISSLLIFIIGRHLYGFKTGFWGLLIYSTATIFVVNSRIVVVESLVTILLLTILYLLLRSSKRILYKKLITVGILCGLSFLSKVLGTISFLVILYFLVAERVKRKYV